MSPKPTRHNTPDSAPAYNWRAEAACASSDPELFFPVGKARPGNTVYDQVERAKEVCRRCKVAQQCLQYALETNQEFGIWGGLTEDERRSLKRRAARDRRARQELAHTATSEMMLY